jgi:hypothetical protein
MRQAVPKSIGLYHNKPIILGTTAATKTAKKLKGNTIFEI